MNIKNRMAYMALFGLLSAGAFLAGCAENETRDEAEAVEPQVVESKAAEEAVVEQVSDVAPVQVIRGEGTGVYASIAIPSLSMFELGQVEINESGKAAIEEYRKNLGPELTDSYMVLVVGHTDTSGEASFNDVVSLQRAQSVADYLVSTGTNADAIRVIGRGSREPVASNETREGRIQNRRVDVLVVAEVRALDTMLFPSVALFERLSAELTEQGQALLDQHTMEAKELLSSAAYIEIVGHTDNVGDENDNMELSKKRAESVRDYLVGKGHDASKMVVAGKGATMPIASNDTEEGRASNRRVQILVLGRIRDHEQMGEAFTLSEAEVITAEVLAIDKENRLVTLRGPENNVVEIEVSEEARNLDQVNVGDLLKVEYLESVAIYLGKAGTQPVVDAEMVMARTDKGEMPGAFAVGTMDMSASIVGIDRDQRTLTLKLPDGEIVTTDVDPAVKLFDTLRVGDTIHARLTKAFAIAVETP